MSKSDDQAPGNLLRAKAYEAWEPNGNPVSGINGKLAAHAGFRAGWDARGAIEIELPEPQPFEISAEDSLEMDPDEFEALEARHGAQWQTYRKCKAAIEAAGLKVKS